MPASVQHDRLNVLVNELRIDLAELETHLRATVASCIRTGDHLAEAKALVPYGEWGRWLHDNFQLTERTARTYMSLARNRDLVGDAPSITAAARALSRASSEGASELRVVRANEPQSRPTEVTPADHARVLHTRERIHEIMAEEQANPTGFRWSRFKQMAEEEADHAAWDQVVARHGAPKIRAYITRLEKERRAISSTIHSLRDAVERGQPRERPGISER